MNRFRKFEEESLTWVEKSLLFLFVVLYPLFVSMYTMLPPLIGVAAYFLIINIEKENIYVLAPLFYLINLDLNLSLPLLLSIALSVLVYMFAYSSMKRLIRCRVCLVFALIFTVDLFYYASLFVYDFIFQSSTVLADMLLIYYIVIDILIGMML